MANMGGQRGADDGAEAKGSVGGGGPALEVRANNEPVRRRRLTVVDCREAAGDGKDSRVGDSAPLPWGREVGGGRGRRVAGAVDPFRTGSGNGWLD